MQTASTGLRHVPSPEEGAGKRCWEWSQDDDSLGVPVALGMIPADGHVCCPADDDYVGLRVSK